MHLLCSITKKVPYFLHKYLCNFITEPHNETNLSVTVSYCSCCTVLPNYKNTNWSQCVLTDSSQHTVPFCIAIRNYKAAQYAINRQLKSRHQQFRSLHSVSFVSVRSVAASSSDTNFAFRAASCTVSTTLHELYCIDIFSRDSQHTVLLHWTVAPYLVVPHYIHSIATLFCTAVFRCDSLNSQYS